MLPLNGVTSILRRGNLKLKLSTRAITVKKMSGDTVRWPLCEEKSYFGIKSVKIECMRNGLFTVSFHGTRLFFAWKTFYVKRYQSILIRWLWNFADDFLLYGFICGKNLEAGLTIIWEQFYIFRAWTLKNHW